MNEDLEHFKKLAATNRRSENLADCSDLSQQIRAICIEVGQRR